MIIAFLMSHALAALVTHFILGIAFWSLVVMGQQRKLAAAGDHNAAEFLVDAKSGTVANLVVRAFVISIWEVLFVWGMFQTSKTLARSRT